MTTDDEALCGWLEFGQTNDSIGRKAAARIRALRASLEAAPKPEQYAEHDGGGPVDVDYARWFHGPRAEALK